MRNGNSACSGFQMPLKSSPIFYQAIISPNMKSLLMKLKSRNSVPQLRKMSAKSDFAQKLLHDLRLHKERVATAQNSTYSYSNSRAMNNTKEKLVVEVVAAHNLMPKDGEGSSSPFVEVEFEKQRLRTQLKTVEVDVFNEKRSNTSRSFLGHVRISGSSIAREWEEMAQLYTLDKISLFSHVRGELSLKLYLSTTEEVKQVINGGVHVLSSGTPNSSVSVKKNKKLQKQTNGTNTVLQMGQENKGNDDANITAIKTYLTRFNLAR